MGDDLNQATETTTTAAPAATEATIETTTTAASEKMLPQSEVNRLIAKARDEGRKSAAKAQPQPQQQSAEPAGAGDGERLTKAELQAKIKEMEDRRRVERRAAKAGLSDEAADDSFDLYRTQKPTDEDVWFDSKTKLLGNGKQVSNQPAIPASEPAKPPAAAPNAPSVPVNPVSSGGLVNLFAMTEAQLSEMTPSEMRGHFEKILDSAAQRSGAPPRPTPTRK